MNKYYAITRSDSDDELQHWKYIKRVKGKNGKWRYIYDTANTDLQKYNSRATIVDRKKNDYGSYDDTVTEYRKNDDLFDSTIRRSYKRSRTPAGGPIERWTHTEEIKYQGKISRAIAKGEKWIFDNFISSSKKSPAQKNITKNIADKVNDGVSRIKSRRTRK